MKGLKLLIVLLSALLSFSLIAENDDMYLSLDKDSVEFFKKKFYNKMEVLDQFDDIALVKVGKNKLAKLSHYMHEEFHRCGGFVFHENEKSAFDHLYASHRRSWAKNSNFVNYSISREPLVTSLLPEIKEMNIRETITSLSSFKNRYYNSKYGVQSSEWIAEKWKTISAARSDVSVELIPHAKWKQDSIMLTFQGVVEDTIVVGGHADSIAGFFGGSNSKAPGADDNASGIATFTEILRVLVDSGYKPYHTLKFIGYAAEEVGLRGSSEIARSFREENRSVKGVLQLDMTNFHGSDLDILIIQDYTNAEQNAFLGALIDKYLDGVSWGYDYCGYACSDHASWHNEGYIASIPFESKKNDMNRKIHTKNDLLKISDGNALHAQKFAKLGLAYVIELDK